LGRVRAASGFGECNEALDHFIEQCGLLEIEHVPAFRKYRRPAEEDASSEQAGLDAIVVLVAADDQGRRRIFRMASVNV